MRICIRCGKTVDKTNINKSGVCKDCHDARSEKNKKNTKAVGKDLEQVSGYEANTSNR